MAAGGDIVELVHEQQQEGQVINNVYYFEAVQEVPNIATLANWFATNVVPDVKLLQQPELTHTNLRLRNLFNLAEAYELPLTGGGTATEADDFATFAAASLRLDHSNASVRPGFKRFGGIGETSYTDGVAVAAIITILQQIGANLVNPPADVNADWAHVIVGRIKYVDPDDGLEKYRLPENQGEANVGYPTEYTASAQLTTQNSRKWYT